MLNIKLQEPVVLAVQVKCEGRDDLSKFFKQIVEKRGEGVILKHWKGKYAPSSPSFPKHMARCFAKVDLPMPAGACTQIIWGAVEDSINFLISISESFLLSERYSGS